jgi:hypothetical protein
MRRLEMGTNIRMNGRGVFWQVRAAMMSLAIIFLVGKIWALCRGLAGYMSGDEVRMDERPTLGALSRIPTSVGRRGQWAEGATVLYAKPAANGATLTTGDQRIVWRSNAGWSDNGRIDRHRSLYETSGLPTPRSMICRPRHLWKREHGHMVALVHSPTRAGASTVTPPSSTSHPGVGHRVSSNAPAMYCATSQPSRSQDTVWEVPLPCLCLPRGAAM